MGRRRRRRRHHHHHYHHHDDYLPCVRACVRAFVRAFVPGFGGIFFFFFSFVFFFHFFSALVLVLGLDWIGLDWIGFCSVCVVCVGCTVLYLYLYLLALAFPVMRLARMLHSLSGDDGSWGRSGYVEVVCEYAGCPTFPFVLLLHVCSQPAVC
ncbi:hypothetical protein IWX50DRAFT_641794 [Phyllosticta citricarpa]